MEVTKNYENYYPAEYSYDFSPKNYIANVFNLYTISYHFDDNFDFEVYKFLNNHRNCRLISFNKNGKISNSDDFGFRGGCFWFKFSEKNNLNFIKLTVKNQENPDDVLTTSELKYDELKIFNISIYAPVGTEFFCIKYLQKFKIKDESGRIHLFIKNSYGENSFEPLPIKVPKNLNIKLNYGKDFVDKYDEIVNKLQNNKTGIHMFHGLPGTGKSTLIKHLSTMIKKDFIYIPNTMLETFINDPSCVQLLIQKPNSVLILEDAEKLIMKRVGDGLDNNGLSTLLNMSDGILSDILNISIILTYNCETSKIDEALLRKGRLKSNYYFGLLSVEDSKSLAEHLKIDKKLIEDIKTPMSISDIYNLTEKVFYNPESEIKKEKKIGFHN